MKTRKPVSLATGIIAILLFFATALFTYAATAAPVAYTEYGHTLVVLTDEQDQTICPIGTYLAVAQSGQERIVGCWAIGADDNVNILWLAPHVLPKSVFEPIKPDVRA